MTNCNQFTSYNYTSAFSTLFTPFTTTTISTTRFTFPLQANGSAPSNLFFNGRGLGSSGTITFLGSEGDEELQQEAGEGVITVDVIIRYAGPQALDDMMRVCEMARDDGGVGVGIYVRLFSKTWPDTGLTFWCRAQGERMERSPTLFLLMLPTFRPPTSSFDYLLLFTPVSLLLRISRISNIISIGCLYVSGTWKGWQTWACWTYRTIVEGWMPRM